MANFDLYSVFRLRRDLSSSGILVILTQELNSATTSSRARQTEFDLALTILGDQSRRDIYDRRLQSSGHPEITLASLSELAVKELSHQEPARSGPNARSTNSRPKNRQVRSITFLAVVSVIAIAAVAGVWIVTRSESENSLAEGVVPTFDEQVTSTSSLAPTDTSDVTSTTHADTENSESIVSTRVGEISRSGWYGFPEASCESEDDRWVFAGGNDDGDLITVCKESNSGDLYYRGYVGRQGGLSWDIDMSSFNEYQFTTVPLGGSFIEINSSGLKVYRSDANGPASEKDFDWFESDFNDRFFDR